MGVRHLSNQNTAIVQAFVTFETMLYEQKSLRENLVRNIGFEYSIGNLLTYGIAPQNAAIGSNT